MIGRLARAGALLAIVALVVTLALAFRRDPHDIRTGTVGKPAPAFTLSRSRDKTYRALPLGHIDLLIGRDAPRMAWPLVSERFSCNGQGTVAALARAARTFH